MYSGYFWDALFAPWIVGLSAVCAVFLSMHTYDSHPSVLGGFLPQCHRPWHKATWEERVYFSLQSCLSCKEITEKTQGRKLEVGTGRRKRNLEYTSYFGTVAITFPSLTLSPRPLTAKYITLSSASNDSTSLQIHWPCVWVLFPQRKRKKSTFLLGLESCMWHHSDWKNKPTNKQTTQLLHFGPVVLATEMLACPFFLPA